MLALLMGLFVLVGCPGGGLVTGPLAAPSGLTATPGTGQIDLTWQDNSTAEEGFRIFRKLEADAAFPAEFLAFTAADVTTYADTLVSSVDSYVYEVRAFAGETNGEPSPPSAPVKPTLGEGKFTLSITRAGAGQGVITSNPTGINCVQRPATNPGACSFDFDKDKAVTLEAQPDASSQFAGWGGACTGLTCTLTLDGSKSVTATFQPIANKLAVRKLGDGTGLVTSDTTDAFKINCGTICEVSSEVKTAYILRAVPDANSVFVDWANCDKLTANGRCEITIGNGKGAEVSARFLTRRDAPTVTTFTADPNIIKNGVGDKIKLSWDIDAKGATDTKLELTDNFPGGSRTYDVSGKGLKDSTIVDVSSSRIFTLKATNFFGTGTLTTTVTAGEAPTITGFKASVPSVTAGSPVTLSWDALPAGTTLQLEKNPATGATTTVDVTGISVADSPIVTTTYTLIATNEFGTTRSNAVAVTVTALVVAPTITAFTATPATSPAPGSPVTLSWTLGGGAPTTLTITPTVGSVLTDADSAVSVSPAVTTIYTLTASNSANAATPATATVTVTVTPATLAPVITSFTATPPTSPSPGSAVTLSWVLGGGAPTALTIDQGVGSVLGQTSIVVNPTVTTTYTLTASNSAGSPTSPTIVTVTPAVQPPTLSNFTASPNPSPSPGTAVTFSWTPGGGAPTSLTLNPGNISVPLTDSSYTLTPGPDATTTYTLTASNSAGANPTPATVEVVVTPAVPPAPIISFTAPTDETYAVSAVVPLTWNIQNGPLTSLKLNDIDLDVAATTAPVTLSALGTSVHTLVAQNANPTPGNAAKPLTTGLPPATTLGTIDAGITPGTYSINWTQAGTVPVSYTLAGPATATIPAIPDDAISVLVSGTASGEAFTLTATNQYGALADVLGTATTPITIP
jgi:Divergent InlB B-repeat domain